MYYDFLVKIPENNGKISISKRGETTYIEYTYARKYFPEKRYNVPQRTTIGKMSEDHPDMMYPNRNFEKYFPEVALPDTVPDVSRSSCIHAGAYMVIRKMIQECKLEEYLSNWDKQGRGLLLELIAYSILSENNAARCYSEYAYRHPSFAPDNEIFSGAVIFRFLSEISEDDCSSFLEKWNAGINKKKQVFLSYDAVSGKCKNGETESAAYEQTQNNADIAILNYSVAYGADNQEPLFYENYPAGADDVSRLQYLCRKTQECGYNKVGFILDHGHFSREGISYMDEHGYDFLLTVNGQDSLVNQVILEHKGEFESRRANLIRQFGMYGMSMQAKLYPDDEKERYFHLYYHAGRASEERSGLENKLQRMSMMMDRCKGMEFSFDGKYDHYYDLLYTEENGKRKFYGYKEKEGAIEEELRLCGYLAIVTSGKMKAGDALALYRNRDTAERLSDSCRNFSFLEKPELCLSEDGLPFASGDIKEAKIFIKFLAMIIRSRIYTQLRKEIPEMDIDPDFMTVPAALRELEKIELIRQPGGYYKLDHSITPAQKTIFSAFGIDEDNARSMALQIGRELMNSEEA